MNWSKEKWTKEDYQKFLDYLKSSSDATYRAFHFKLLKNDNIQVIGVRTPLLKQLAKQISLGNYTEFISLNRHEYYEEDVIYGFILGYLKLDFQDLLNLLKEFTKHIDNWATNDLVCSNLKMFKKNLELGFYYIEELLKSQNRWENRFSLVLLLNFYVNDEYIDKVLKIASNIQSNDYYVLMANAWLLSICYIKYKDKTFPLFKEPILDDFTHNKAISKIIESNRISKEEKKEIRKWKRKKEI